MSVELAKSKDGDRVTWEMSCCGETKLFHGTIRNPRSHGVQQAEACLVFDDLKAKNEFIEKHMNHPDFRA